jgi:O-6-methylguanine DNA methyltransferase
MEKRKLGFAIYKCKFGLIRIEYENEVITFLKKVKGEINDIGKANNLTDKVYQELLEYFDGKRKDFDFPYRLKGTDFQKKVWTELLTIPYGETRSYKEIATAIGNKKAARAVGMANNKNPITIIVPCHRVIGANGKLVGYAGGLEMKKELLKMEDENNK